MSEPGIAPPGHRLPGGTRVGHVMLQVADIGRSLAFYRDLVGFLEIARESDAAVQTAALGAPDATRSLVVLREKRGVRPVPRRGLLGLYHFALRLPDRASLGRFLRHALNAGVSFGSADHLVSEALYLTDPDGLQMEVYADRPRETWRIRGSEVQMAVDPLDTEGLLAASDGAAWSGVPAGSTIGHMHFSVGDLGRAEAFYHTGLGFDKVAWSFPGALFISAGGYHHHVGLNTWAAGAPAATDADARLVEWELILPDDRAVASAIRGVQDAGFAAAEADGPPAAADPWGIRVVLATAESSAAPSA